MIRRYWSLVRALKRQPLLCGDSVQGTIGSLCCPYPADIQVAVGKKSYSWQLFPEYP